MNIPKLFTFHLSLFTLVLTSCTVRDPIYETPHPNHGRIALTTDWTARGAGIDIPDRHTLAIGTYTATLTGTGNELEELFPPGPYTLAVYNPTTNPAVSGMVATADYTDPQATPPDWLFTSVQPVAIEPNTLHSLTANMQQQVRQLTLVVEPTGTLADRIESITATLTGVAATLDFQTATHTNPTTMLLTFARINQGADQGKWTATTRLLGVAPGSQQLSGTITLDPDIYPQPIPLQSDLTAGLADFNDTKNQPLQLGGNIDLTPTGPEFTATINQWVPRTGTGVAE